jgi:hypothetical protein
LSLLGRMDVPIWRFKDKGNLVLVSQKQASPAWGWWVWSKEGG